MTVLVGRDGGEELRSKPGGSVTALLDVAKDCRRYRMSCDNPQATRGDRVPEEIDR